MVLLASFAADMGDDLVPSLAVTLLVLDDGADGTLGSVATSTMQDDFSSTTPVGFPVNFDDSFENAPRIRPLACCARIFSASLACARDGKGRSGQRVHV
jgi:hypothetical protein